MTSPADSGTPVDAEALNAALGKEDPNLAMVKRCVEAVKLRLNLTTMAPPGTIHALQKDDGEVIVIANTADRAKAIVFMDTIIRLRGQGGWNDGD